MNEENEHFLSQTPPSTTNDDISNGQLLSLNSNSNNNTPDPPASLIGFDGHVTFPYTKPTSMISTSDDKNSTVSTNLSKYEKEADTDCPDMEQEVPAWYLSPTPSPYHPPERDSSVSITEKLEKEDFECLNDFSPIHEVMSPPPFVSPVYQHSSPQTIHPAVVTHTPIDLTSMHEDDQQGLGFSLKSREPSSIRQNLLLHDRLDSDPDSVTFTHSPVCYSRSMDDSCCSHDTNAYSGLNRSWSLRQRQDEKDFAIEYTLQSQLQPVMIHSNTNHTAATDYEREGAGSVDHIYSHPRPVRLKMSLSYKGSFSERNTPESPRGGFKVGYNLFFLPVPTGAHLNMCVFLLQVACTK